MSRKDGQEWLTTAQVAEMTGTSAEAVRRHAARLGAVRTGSGWQFPADEVRRVMAETGWKHAPSGALAGPGGCAQ